MTNIDISKKKFLHFLIIAVITIAAYSNSFNVPFQFDDRINIEENPYIKDFSFFAHPSNTKEDALLFETRYLGHLSFAVNYALGRLDVHGYHLVNISIHLANAALIYWLVVLLFKTPRIASSRLAGHAEFVALFTSLCFSLHPVETQAVTYIVQRFASLSTMFYLGSVVLYINHRLSGRRIWYTGSLLSGLCAMYTKELSATLPVMVLLAEIVFFDGRLWERAKRLAPFGVMLFVIPLTMYLSGGRYGKIIGTQGLEATLPRYDYLMTEFRVIVTYIRLLVAPYGQNLEYDYPEYHSLRNPAVFMSFILLSFILSGACYALIKTRRNHVVWDPALRLASFGVLWFFIALSVESGIIPIRHVIFEHRMYLPSVGFMICAVTLFLLLIERLPVRKKGLVNISALVAITVFLSLTTYSRNIVWESKISLWSDAVRKAPGNPLSNYTLGTAYYEAGDYNNAITYLKKALQISKPYDKTNEMACNNLSASYFQIGMNDKAIVTLRTCLGKFPDKISLHVNLAEGYKRKRQFSEAISTFERALEIDSNYYKALIGLANIFKLTGKTENAIIYYKKALSIREGDVIANNNLASMYLKANEPDKALPYIKACLAKNPGNSNAVYLLEMYNNIKKVGIQQAH